jgi:predicted nucleic acid-binding protein
MRIVKDTNIIIRILINPDGFVASLFYPVKNKYDFFVSYSTFEEINKHKPRLLKISKLTQYEFDSLLAKVVDGVSLISMQIIPTSIFLRALKYTTSVDLDDLPFVASALFIKGHLWTSDKVLFNGLKRNGFQKVINNADISGLINPSKIAG